MRAAPGLIAVLATLLCATPAVEAAPCKGKRACKAQAKAKKAPKPLAERASDVIGGEEAKGEDSGEPVAGPSV